MTIGERLLKLRKEKNISQEELANVLDVSRQTISKWETGESMPDFNKIIPICEYFEISTDELLTGIKKGDNLLDVKKENKFYGYIDTSAKDDIGISRVFDEIGEMLIKIYGKRKKGHNVKLAAKAKKHEGGCGLCQPDV